MRMDGGISERIIDRALELAGLNPFEERSISEINKLVKGFTTSKEVLANIQTYFLQAAFEQLSPDEMAELAGFTQSKPEIEPVFHGQFRTEDMPDLLNSPELMTLASDETGKVLLMLDQLPIPNALKKTLHWLLDAKSLMASAEFLRWQEESRALKEIRPDN